MDKEIQSFFADSVINVSYLNGVFRITFGEQDADKTLKPSGRILIPASQLNVMLNGIAGAAGDIGQQLEQRTMGEKAKESSQNTEAEKAAKNSKPTPKTRARKTAKK